jgi:methyl-accepting chemotaxis protein
MERVGLVLGQVGTVWRGLTDLRRGRLAPRLIALSLLAALVPLAAAVSIGGRAATSVLTEQAEANLQGYAAAIAGQVEFALAAHLKDAKVLAADPGVVRFLALPPEQRESGTQAAAQAAVQRFVASDAAYTTGFLLSDKGHVQYSTDPALYSRPDLSGRAYFKEAMAGRPTVSDVALGVNVQSSPALFFTAPVKDAAGTIIGTATLRINAETVWARLDEGRLSPRSLVALIDEDGVVIGPGRPQLLWRSLGQVSPEAHDTLKARFNLERVDSLGLDGVATALKAAQAAIAAGNGEGSPPEPGQQAGKTMGHVRFAFSPPASRAPAPLGTGAPGDRDGGPGTADGSQPAAAAAVGGQGGPAAPFAREAQEGMVGGYAFLASRRWAVLLMQPEAEFLAPLQRAATAALPAVGLVCFLVVAWVAWAVTYAVRRQFQDPVKEMLGVMELVSAGELDARVPAAGAAGGAADELGRLGARLNGMLDSLTELVQTREERDALQERIQRLLAEVSAIAEGDLTVQAEVTADVTGALADAFNFMTDELRKIVLGIDRTTGQVTAGATQVLAASQDLAARSRAQATHLADVSTAVAQMAQAIGEVSENASRSAGVADEALANAGRGGAAVAQVVDAMGAIRANAYATAQKIKRLGESSVRVGEIVQLIEDLADQTNLLALNAAIQAASAGEHGRGFAVVADEVRRLAERSAEATGQIESLIHAIQADTAAAVAAMEESTQQVVAGSRLADDAGRSLEAIQTVVADLAKLITAISSSAQHHAEASRRVVASMQEVASVTEQTTASTEQTAERVSSLARLAEHLRASVAAFRLPSSSPA